MGKLLLFLALSLVANADDSAKLKEVCGRLAKDFGVLKSEVGRAQFLYKNGTYIQKECEFDSREVYKTKIRLSQLELVHRGMVSGCSHLESVTKCLNGINNSFNSAKLIAAPFIFEEKKDAFVKTSETNADRKLVPAWSCKAAGKIRPVLDPIICDGDSSPNLIYIEEPRSFEPTSVDKIPAAQRKELGVD